MQWRVRPAVPVMKLLGAVAVLALAATFGRDDPVRWALGGVAAAALVTWAARDLVAPVRLAADPAAVTVVAGFARRRRLAWEQIERVRVDRTVRRGLRSVYLEVDAGDAIYLFSPYELNADPEDVLAALDALRAGDGHSPG